MDYRYRPRQQQFKKFQWIEVELDSHGSNNDRRKESRRPVLDSIKLLGEPVGTGKDWRERRRLIDTTPAPH